MRNRTGSHRIANIQLGRTSEQGSRPLALGGVWADVVDFSVFKDLVWTYIFIWDNCLTGFRLKYSLSKSLLK